MKAAFVSLHLQETIFFAEKIFFIFSSSLSVLAMGFLLKQTSPSQVVIRNYLILIQVFVILTDCVLQLLAEPIVLFPVWAGYCCGVLTRVLSVKQILGLAVFLLSNIGISIVVCCIYRHQSILFDSNLFKLRKKSLQILRISLFVFFNCGPIILTVLPTDQNVVDQLIEKAELQWIRERSSAYLMQQWSFPLFCAIVIVISVLICAALLLIGLFWHMYYVLNQDAQRRSSASISMIRKSLGDLFIQLVIPLSLIVLPALFIGFGLAVPGLVSFEVSFAMFYVIHLHALGHNLILLAITPSYRRIIHKFVRCDHKDISVRSSNGQH